MPLTYRIDDGLLTFTTIGDVEFSAGMKVLLEGLSQYATSGAQRPRILFDLEQSIENRSAADLRSIAVVVGQNVPSARIACLVASDLHYGLSRMFGVYLGDDGMVMRVFYRDRAKAMVWLGE